MLSHAVLAFVTVSWLADLTPLDETDVTLHAAPLSHGAGFHAIAAAARAAHQVITPTPSFDPAGVLDLVDEHGVTNTWMVPTQIVMLDGRRARGYVVLPTLEYVVYGGAPMTPAATQRALDRFGPVFVQLYGQGETPMTATVLRRQDHRPDAARLGRPRPSRRRRADHERERRARTARHGRRGRRARSIGDERLLEPTRGLRRDASQRLAPHRRPRAHLRRRSALPPRPHQGHDHLGWLQCVRGRGRAGAERPPRRGRCRSGRRARRLVGRAGRRRRRPRRRRRFAARHRRARSALPRRAGGLQDPTTLGTGRDPAAQCLRQGTQA